MKGDWLVVGIGIVLVLLVLGGLFLFSATDTPQPPVQVQLAPPQMAPVNQSVIVEPETEGEKEEQPERETAAE